MTNFANLISIVVLASLIGIAQASAESGFYGPRGTIPQPRAALMLAATAPISAPAATPTKPVLTLEGARRIAAVAETFARDNQAPGAAIAIVDDGGQLLFLERLDGTFAAGSRISTGKARTAALFRKPTKVFEEIVNKGRTSMTALDDFTPLQGGVPLLVNGQLVGAIGVSGAASADQDSAIAEAGAKAAEALAR